MFPHHYSYDLVSLEHVFATSTAVMADKEKGLENVFRYFPTPK
jgi:hypothetical protein